MIAARRTTGRWSAVTLLALLALLLASCGSDSSASSASGESDAGAADTDINGTLKIGAIPDQDPEQLARTYGLVADYLEDAVPGLTVEYVPVTDYQGAVAGFRTGDLDFVWFGGLTGVQARLEVDGANAVAQRDIDAEFTSVFIANTSTGIQPFDDVAGLSALTGTRFTYGSESSTSGRLMPQAFLGQAGIDPAADFDGAVGFSGSHDATIEQVQAGTFETGALNSQVWDSRREDGSVDESAVIEVFRTPSYFDYHWVARPDIDERLGTGATEAVVEALLALDASDPDQAAILDLFGAGSFIRTENANYADIEQVGRDAGLINQ
ncbi:MAG: putative selenate ABC transporter substrate-binding protein [Acidimicrobiales bacterium]